MAGALTQWITDRAINDISIPTREKGAEAVEKGKEALNEAKEACRLASSKHRDTRHIYAALPREVRRRAKAGMEQVKQKMGEMETQLNTTKEFWKETSASLDKKWKNCWNHGGPKVVGRDMLLSMEKMLEMVRTCLQLASNASEMQDSAVKYFRIRLYGPHAPEVPTWVIKKNVEIRKRIDGVGVEKKNEEASTDDKFID